MNITILWSLVGAIVVETLVVCFLVWRLFKQRQLKSAPQNQDLKELIDLLPEGVFIADSKGTILYGNPAAFRLLGYTEQDVEQGLLNILQFIVPEEREAAIANIRKTLNKQPSGNRYTMLRKDGSPFPVYINAMVMTKEGQPVGFCGMVIDSTKQQKLEEQLKQTNALLEQRIVERTRQLAAANQELEAFSFSVSHDLRSPLRSLDGFSTLLREEYYDQIDENGQNYLNRISAAAKRMGKLIDDLLRLSRITRSDMRFEDVDLSGMANKIMEDLQNETHERQVKWIIPSGLQVRADPVLLKIALTQLLNNAWKFTRQVPEACIEFGVSQREGKGVYFIRDNGIGFDMAHAGKLFVPFQRLHSDDYEGDGIGLAIAQRVIRRHGGVMWAEAGVQKGAVFYFTLG
jgi:PAS domain S-box-containing protein